MKTDCLHKLTTLIVAIITLTTCTPREGRFTTVGHIEKINDKFTTIITINNDTLTYPTKTLQSLSFEKIFEKDSVLINYIDTLGNNNAIGIVVISHNLPNINNRSAMLVGTWQSTISQQDTISFRVKFKADSTVEIFQKNNNSNCIWMADGDSILLTNDLAKKQRYNLIRVDNSTLTLYDGARIVHFAKID